MKIQKNLYKNFIHKELPLSDRLAAARSILANERTYLSYQSMSITLFVAGLTFIKFFDIHVIIIVGWIFVPASVITFFLGILRYKRMRDLIRNMEHEQYIIIKNKNLRNQE